MRQVVATFVLVLLFEIALALVSLRLRGRHKRGAKMVRLLVGAPLLAAYAYGVLHLTLLGRTTGEVRAAKLGLFWSHRESLALVGGGLSVTNAGLLAEIVLNVLLFMPMGALLPFLFPSLVTHGKTVHGSVVVSLAACVCSLAIELAQWRFRLGLFEFDDVLDNTLGTFLGYVVYCMIWWSVAGTKTALENCEQKDEKISRIMGFASEMFMNVLPYVSVSVALTEFMCLQVMLLDLVTPLEPTEAWQWYADTGLN